MDYGASQPNLQASWHTFLHKGQGQQLDVVIRGCSQFTNSQFAALSHSDRLNLLDFSLKPSFLSYVYGKNYIF